MSNPAEETTKDGRALQLVAKPALPTFNLTPKTLAEALELAKLMADSDIVPKDFRGKPGNVLIAVQMGAEVGLSPMAAIQSIAVINGRPGIYGDAGKGLLLDHGCEIDEADAEEIRKTGIARCTIRRPGRQPVTRTFSLEDAKQAKLLGKEGPWTNYRERMLAWRAFWFAARDAAADILKGLGGGEELEDLPREPRNITPESERPTAPPRKSERATEQQPATIDAKAQSTAAATGQEKQPTAPADAAVSPPPASGNGEGTDFNLVNRIYKLIPAYNRVKGDGAATKLMEQSYEVAHPSKLKPAEAEELIKTLEATVNG